MVGFNLRKRVCAITQYSRQLYIHDSLFSNYIIDIINGIPCISSRVNINNDHEYRDKLIENIYLFLDAFDAHVQKINKQYDDFYITKSRRRWWGFGPKKDIFNNKKYTYISQLVKTPQYYDKIVRDDKYDKIFNNTYTSVATLCIYAFNAMTRDYCGYMVLLTNEVIDGTIYEIFKQLSLLQQGEYIGTMYLKRRCGSDITRYIMKYVVLIPDIAILLDKADKFSNSY